MYSRTICLFYSSVLGVTGYLGKTFGLLYPHKKSGLLKPQKKHFTSSLLFILCFFSFNSSAEIHTSDFAPATPISGREITSNTILPADVFARLQLYQQLLQPLAQHMGKSLNQSPLMKVSNVEPRDVIFQAHSLVDKTKRLSTQLGINIELLDQFELGQIYDKNNSRIAETKPYDVWMQVSLASASLDDLLKTMGIEHKASEPLADENLIPTDAYNLLLVIHRNLNSLFLNPIQHSDVYALVTQASHLCADLISAKTTTEPYPRIPKLDQTRINNSHVFEKVINIVGLVKTNLAESDHSLESQFSAKTSQQLSIHPSDSYDAMQWVLADLINYHQMHSNSPAISPYYPGIKFPKDIYSRLSMLELQLQKL